MKGTPAIYKGRVISKDKFRTFIYDTNGNKKLVESWDEFESCMQTGIWFASKKEAQNIQQSNAPISDIEDEPVVEAKPKAKAKPKSKVKPKPEKIIKPQEVEESQDDHEDDGMVFEVKDNE